MKRKIVKINKEKCTGCGACITACHEGALKLVNGKAELVSDSYCDGLGACLPDCPADAITIEEREADEFNEEAVKRHLESISNPLPEKLACGCPGSQVRTIEKNSNSHLTHWPCQIKLVPVNAPFLDNADLLVAADCTAYAYASIHDDFMQDKVTLIGCPKLDNYDYTEKFTEIFKTHSLKSITVLRMKVPCCGGLVKVVEQALVNSGQAVPRRIVTVGTDGSIIEEEKDVQNCMK